MTKPPKKPVAPPKPASPPAPTHDRRGHLGSTRGRNDMAGRKHKAPQGYGY